MVLTGATSGSMCVCAVGKLFHTSVVFLPHTNPWPTVTKWSSPAGSPQWGVREMQLQPGGPLCAHHWLRMRVERGRHVVTKVGTAHPGEGGERRKSGVPGTHVQVPSYFTNPFSTYSHTDPHSRPILSNP